MKITRSSLLVTFLVVAAPACGNRLLVGEGPDGGGPTGVAGTGVLATGTAGAPVPNTGAGGGGGGTYTHVVTPLRITGKEAVSRLATVIWGTQPDADLLAQADMGRFTTTEDLYGPVRQLLADPRARSGVGAFYRWWLDLDRLTKEISTDPMLRKDQTLFPAFSPELAADMATETETFGVNVTLDPNGNYWTLMIAGFTYANDRLAALYGVTGGTGNTTFNQIQLPPGQRAGLLTQPSLQVLTSYATRNAPTRRGAEIVRQFLCLNVPAPPEGFPPPPVSTDRTTRQWLEESVADANCAACHVKLDPQGLALENFDAIGRWRTTDNGFPINVSELELRALPTQPVISGPVQLAEALSNSPQAQECMARQWLAYALGRDLSKADDASVAQATAAFRGTRLNLKELIYAVLTSDAFLAP